MRHYLLNFLFLFLFAFTTFASSVEYHGEEAGKRIPGATMIWIKDHMQLPSYIRFREDAGIPMNDAIDWLTTHLKLAEGISFRVIKEENDRLGYSHIRLQQTYLDRPVALAYYTLHVRNGLVVSVSGDIHQKIDAPEGPFITAEQALKMAVEYTGAQSYKWQIPAEEAHLKLSLGDMNATYQPQPQLVVVPVNANLRNAVLRYAYQMDVYAHQPESRKEIYIDAIDGSVVLSNERIHTIDSLGTAVTAYSDTVELTTDTYAGGFRLFENGRGNGIHTWNLETRTNTSTAVEFTDADNFWDNFNPQKDEYATDAHWGAEMTYDYILTAFNRNSIDGNGHTLNSYVHFDVEWSNASWNGFSMRYGDGTASSPPYTTLDITGHEIGHGLTDYTADLIYQDEFGALNESFSDILGASIEFFVKGSQANWRIGEDRGSPIRNMSNPNSHGDPDTYRGNNWFTGVLDNGGVHINSGVQNFWYYLLVEGGNGTNDHDSVFSVQGIGLQDAAQIAYRNLSVYLGRVSEYEDARFFAIQSAIDLFGSCSPQHAATVNAWFAVGLGNRYHDGAKSDFEVEIATSCQLPFIAQFVNKSENATSYTWEFGNGKDSDELAPAHLYDEEGNYTVTLYVDGGACGKDTLTKEDLINIHPIETPDPAEDTVKVCPGEIATLSASSSAEMIKWYKSETADSAIFTGPQYQAGPLQSSISYYAQGVTSFPVKQAGPEDNTFGDGQFSNSEHRLLFDAYASMELVSVLIYTASNRERTIELYNSNDSLLASKTVFVEQGEHRVDLNFLIDAGVGYQLGFAENSSPQVYRGSENADYPYITPGIVSITGTTAPPQQFYYYFFDWEVKLQDCISERREIRATVEDCKIPSGGASGYTLYPNPAINDFKIDVLFKTDDYLKVRLFNVNGQLVRDYDQNSYAEGLHQVSLSTAGIAPGIYYLKIESSSLDEVEKLIISR